MATPTTDPADLTRRFRAARAYADVGLKEAADELETSERTLQRIEKGEKPVPATYVAWAISKWNVPSWLLPGDDDARDGLALGGQTLRGAAQRSADQRPGETEGDSDALGGTG